MDMDRLEPNAPERLTPDPAAAIEGMREVFMLTFQAKAGVGSARIAAATWQAWRDRLVGEHGLLAAEQSAILTALARRASGGSAFRPWITDRRLRAATREASQVATNWP